MSDFSLREFSFYEDYPRVYALWQNVGPGVRVGRSDEPEEIEKKLGRDPDLFLVAEVNGELVGSVIGGFDGRRGIVYHLAVAEPFRHLGIATALMDEIEYRLRAKGCIRCYLFITDDNADIFHFYENRNWQRMDTVTPLAKDL